MGDGSRTTKWWPVVVAGLWVLAALCVLVAVVVTRSDDGAAADALPPVGTARLEPVTYRNPASFTDSIVTGSVEELPDLVAHVVASDPTTTSIPSSPEAPVDGHAPLLYATRGSEPVCNGAALTAALAADSALAAAWAEAAQVQPADAAGTIAALTPVVLTRDTAVTNHIYRSGKPRAYQAILEAGTPVMVDSAGVPRVQCSCGNPLGTPSEERPSKTDGDAWQSFDADAVAVVAPAPAAAPQLATIDLDTAKPSTTPTGTNMALTGILVAADDGLQIITPDNQTVNVLDEAVDAVYDDGRGGLYYTLADPGNPYRNEPPSAVEAAAIWYLAPGSSEAVQFVPPAQGGWNQLLGVGRLGDQTYVVYNPLVMDTSIPEEPFASGSTVARDVDSGIDTVLEQGSEGWESGVVATSFGGDRLGILYSQEVVNVWEFFGPGLQPLTTVCETADFDAPEESKPCPGNGTLDESGMIVAFGDQDEESPLRTLTVDPVTGQRGASVTLAPTAGNGEYLTDAVHARSGRLVTSTLTGNELVQDETEWQVFDLANGAEVTPALGGRKAHQLWTVTAPIIRPQAVPPAAPQQASYHAPTMEELRAGFPSAVCDSDAGAIPLGTDDDGQSSEDPASQSYIYIKLQPEATVAADVDGDGVPETVVAPVCNWGGSGYSTPVAALRAGPDGIEVLGEPYDEFGRTIRTIDRLSPAVGGVDASGGSWTDGDAACCPSRTFTTTLRFANGSWHEG